MGLVVGGEGERAVAGAPLDRAAGGIGNGAADAGLEAVGAQAPVGVVIDGAGR